MLGYSVLLSDVDILTLKVCDLLMQYIDSTLAVHHSTGAVWGSTLGRCSCEGQVAGGHDAAGEVDGRARDTVLWDGTCVLYFARFGQWCGDTPACYC